MEEENKCVDKIDVEYKYFDKIDVNYIRKHQQEFINKEEYYTFIKPKVDKYKDSGLNDIDKGPVNYKGIYDTIYHKIGVDLKIYDNLIWHKFFNEEYNGVKGVRTANEICLFYKELMHLLGIDDDELYVNFTTYIQDFGSKGMLDKDNNDSNQSTNPANISNNVERNRNDDKFNYKLMHDLLYSYIPNGTEPIYKSIVERHVLPKDAQSLKMKDDIKANIIRFADCFGISISEINQIFDIKVDSNNRPKEYINDFFRVLKQINPDFTK